MGVTGEKKAIAKALGTLQSVQALKQILRCGSSPQLNHGEFVMRSVLTISVSFIP